VVISVLQGESESVLGVLISPTPYLCTQVEQEVSVLGWEENEASSLVLRLV